MPLPAAAAAAAAWWIGPAALAAAKAMAFEYLPAVSSATLGYLLVRLAWLRCVPEWIRQDVSFQTNGINFTPPRKSKTGSARKSGRHNAEEKKSDDYHEDSKETELERMSSVIEKIQALMVSAQENIRNNNSNSNRSTSFTNKKNGNDVVVPHIYASILAYIQLSAQLKRITSEQQSIQQQQQQSTRGANVRCHHHSLLYQSAGRPIFEETTTATEKESEIAMLQTSMEYAIAAYYVDDPEHLLELLNQNNDSEKPLELLQHSINTRPGSVGHFVALDRATKTCWIGAKGTSSLEDVFTDSCGRSVSYDDPHLDTGSTSHNNNKSYSRSGGACVEQQTESYSRVEVSRSQHQVFVFQNNNIDNDSSLLQGGEADERIVTATFATSCSAMTEEETSSIEVICQEHDEIHVVDHGQDDVDLHIRCHEGILIAAQRLLNKVHDLIVELVVQGDYQLVLTGHSLGAGAVCLLAMLLRSRYPSLVDSTTAASGSSKSRDGQGDGGGEDCTITTSTTPRKMQVYAFASPPVLDHDAAVAASRYMTCVVHHADLIPRSSLANVAVLLEFLRTIATRLVELDRAPSGGVQSTIAFLRMLSQGSNGEPILSLEQVDAAMQAARDKVELRHIDHLYVPGRVLLIYDHDSTNETGDTTTSIATASSTTPLAVEEKDNARATNIANAAFATETAASKVEEKDSDKCSSDNIKGEEREPCAVCDSEENTETNADDEKSMLLDTVTALEDAVAAMVATGPFCVVTEGTTPALRTFQVDGFRMLGDHTSGSYMAAIDALAQKEQTLRQLYLQHQTHLRQLEQHQQQQQQQGTNERDAEEEGRQLQTMASATTPPPPLLRQEDACNEISNNRNRTSGTHRQENDETCHSSKASSSRMTTPAMTRTMTTMRETTGAVPVLPLSGSV
jgi:pimeloyl-ACP methyl ester carboxylesterase